MDRAMQAITAWDNKMNRFFAIEISVDEHACLP